jgi:hypothetical protein
MMMTRNRDPGGSLSGSVESREQRQAVSLTFCAGGTVANRASCRVLGIPDVEHQGQATRSELYVDALEVVLSTS